MRPEFSWWTLSTDILPDGTVSIKTDTGWGNEWGGVRGWTGGVEDKYVIPYSIKKRKKKNRHILSSFYLPGTILNTRIQ